MFMIEPETVLYLHRQKTERLMKRIPHLLAVAETGRPLALRVQEYWRQLFSRTAVTQTCVQCSAASQCC